MNTFWFRRHPLHRAYMSALVVFLTLQGAGCVRLGFDDSDAENLPHEDPDPTDTNGQDPGDPGDDGDDGDDASNNDDDTPPEDDGGDNDDNDDDTTPLPTAQWAVERIGVMEGASSLHLTLELSAAGSGVSLGYSVAGTAVHGVDHSISAGVFTVPDGATSTQLEVALIDNALVQPPRTLVITLTDAQNAILGDNTEVTLVLWDDDAPHNLVEASVHTTCAVRPEGHVCVGTNFNGQLGTTPFFSTSSPVAPALSSPAASVSSSEFQTCALVDGTVLCTAPTGEFSEVLTDAVSVRSSQGYSNTHCAITSSGGVQCWGYNHHGQLGDGTTSDRSTPAPVIGLPGPATEIGVGTTHACALIAGDVWCWGGSWGGQMGTGDVLPSPQTAPVQAAGLPPIRQLSVGAAHTCVLADTQAIYCWGLNEERQVSWELGSWSTHTPTQVSFASLDPTGGVQRVAAGGDHTCVGLDQGVACWGKNHFGQRGLSNLAAPPTVAWVPDLPSAPEIIHLTADMRHTCALYINGDTYCFGHAGFGQLGPALPVEVSPPVAAVGLGSSVTAVALGTGGWNAGHFGCATHDESVACWGQNHAGQLGTNDEVARSTPIPIAGLPAVSAPATARIATGGAHACALINGAMACWGANVEGALGDGSNSASSTPVEPAGMNAGVSSIAAGDFHTCAVRDTQLWCWGKNDLGQLGIGHTNNVSSPQQVFSEDVTAVAAGNHHTCAVVDNEIWCWGHNAGGASTQDETSPVQVSGLPSDYQAVTHLSGGAFFACAVIDADVYCWGTNWAGQLGYAGAESSMPVAVEGIPAGEVTHLASTASYSCAAADRVYCWGTASAGQLGVSVTTTAGGGAIPIEGLPAGTVQAVATGITVACAIIDEAMWCWGAHTFGQRADGSAIYTTTPLRVQ